MKWTQKWKERLADRKDLYDKEELRLKICLNELDPFDERYDQIQAKLKNNLAMRDTSKESRRKLCKSDRGNVVIRILGIGGAIAGGFMIGKFEKEGLTYTGEKRTFMDTVTKLFGNMFFSNK